MTTQVSLRFVRVHDLAYFSFERSQKIHITHSDLLQFTRLSLTFFPIISIKQSSISLPYLPSTQVPVLASTLFLLLMVSSSKDAL